MSVDLLSTFSLTDAYPFRPVTEAFIYVVVHVYGHTSMLGQSLSSRTLEIMAETLADANLQSHAAVTRSVSSSELLQNQSAEVR